MTAPATPSPAPSTCSACGRASVTEGVCAVCGFAGGENNRCPHCGSIARVEPRGLGKALHWVCGVCGGPRMPNGAGGEASLAPLREAKASESRARNLRVIAVSFAFIASLFTLFSLLIWVLPAALIWKLLFLAAAVTPAVLAMRTRGRATAATADANEALERAWLAAAEDVTKRAPKGVTVAELANRLKVEPERADALLTKLAANEHTRIDVDDDAEVRYSISSGGPADPTGRVRIDDSDARFRALEEAEAAASGEDPHEEAQKALLSDPFPRSRR